jgi:hypothetical protein
MASQRDTEYDCVCLALFGYHKVLKTGHEAADWIHWVFHTVKISKILALMVGGVDHM